MKKDGTLLIKHVEGLSDQEKLELQEYFLTNETKVFFKKYIYRPLTLKEKKLS